MTKLLECPYMEARRTDIGIQEYSVHVIQPCRSFSTCQMWPQRTQKGAVSDNCNRGTVLRQRRHMRHKALPIRRSICGTLRCIFGYRAILCKMRHDNRVATEHDPRGILRSAECRCTDKGAIDVKPGGAKALSEYGRIVARPSRTDLCQTWITYCLAHRIVFRFAQMIATRFRMAHQEQLDPRHPL